MNFTATVQSIRKAKHNATILARTGSPDAARAAESITHLNKALESMGQSTGDHIPVTQVISALPGGATAGSPTARFGTVPPPSRRNIAAKYDEKKSAEVAEVDDAEAPDGDSAKKKTGETTGDTHVENESGETLTDEVDGTSEDDTKLAAAAASGQITEVDKSKETLQQIVDSTNDANLERLGGVEGVQKLTEAIGGTPNPKKSKGQQATILKAAAKKALAK